MKLNTDYLPAGVSSDSMRLIPVIIVMPLLLTLFLAVPGAPTSCFAAQADPPAAVEEPGKQASHQGATAVPTLSQGDLYALVVGISRYKNSAVPTLHGAANDAKAFARFLESQKDLYKDLRIELLTDEQSTKSALENYLKVEIRKAGKSDTVVLFFSGHGAADPKRPGQFFFLTYDADPQSLDVSSLNMSGLAFLKDLACPRIALIADACHSGGLSEWKSKSGLSPMKAFVRDFVSSAGKVVITSSRPDEYSLESRYRETGVFTHWFLEGLKGAADKDGRGMVTVNEAYAYAYQQTKIETNGAQHPQFQASVQGTFPLAITANLEGRLPTMLELTTAPSGSEVLVGGILKGGTSNDGSLCLKYLPVGRPIPVLIRKEGWVKKELLPPVEFSEEKPHVVVPPVSLGAAVASLEVATAPGDVTVKIDGQPVGKTDAKGKLTLDTVQVCVNHLIELEKQGFNKEPINLTIPDAYEGKKAEMEPVRLSKVSTERPIDRILKDYRAEHGSGNRLKSKWGFRDLDTHSEQDKKIIRAFPGKDDWDLSVLKGKRGFRQGIGDRVYMKEMQRDMLNPGRRKRMQ